MCNQETIKREAFRKLDDFVKGELSFLIEIKKPLGSFNMDNMLKDYLTEEETLAVRNSLQQLREGNIIDYCTLRGIDIPQILIH